MNHPQHYNQGRIEAIDFIEDQDFNFRIGTVLKYLARYRHKQNPVEDLKKAKWYLEREIEVLKNAPKNT